MVLTFLGYAAALLIGLSLGLIGGGGSILTVPILVYLLAVPATLATAYSLFVVGTTSLIGAYKYQKQGLVEFKTALAFGLPAFVGVYSTRRWLIPALPETIMQIGNYEISKNQLIMLVFAIVMLMASTAMIRPKKTKPHKPAMSPALKVSLTAAEGLIVGGVTGFVGAGGGFLIIPALVLLADLEMKRAIATSLLIIAVKSLIGFIGDLQVAADFIQWQMLLIFTSISIAGIFIGSHLTKFIDGQHLKQGFGYFVLVMSFFILGKELF